MAARTPGQALAAHREREIRDRLAVIQAEAARRTGWQPWMTDEVGWGALGPDYVEYAEKYDRQMTHDSRDELEET